MFLTERGLKKDASAAIFFNQPLTSVDGLPKI
jgi:hypothetical protein